MEDPAVEVTRTSIRVKRTINDVGHSLVEAHGKFLEERGAFPAFFLIGWRAWLLLGQELGDERRIFRASHFMAVPLVIDEERPDVIQAMPDANTVRLGGGV